MKIINATPKDKEELLSLYHAMIGDHVSGARIILTRIP